jgi:Co/Zn/Cd efflux system component
MVCCTSGLSCSTGVKAVVEAPRLARTEVTTHQIAAMAATRRISLNSGLMQARVCRVAVATGPVVRFPPLWWDGGVDAAPVVESRRLRRVVLTVAGLNLGYFFVEVSVALAIGSVALLADSVDFLEDTAINLLIALALGWPLRRRAVAGHAMALIILVPALVAAWQAVVKALDPVAPDVTALIVTAGGAAVVNAVSALLLVRVRHHAGSLSGAAYLSARNDVVINLAIIAMALVTAWTGSGWPDIVLGCVIALVSSRAAWEVWELAGEERLAARALAGDDLDD